MSELDILVGRVNKLDLDDREMLVKRVIGRISYEKTQKAVTRYSFLVELAKDATGKEMKGDRRNAGDVKVRMFVAYRMSKEGFSLGMIGKAMNRSHASVLHLIRNMEGHLDFPITYEDEVAQYRLFSENIERDERIHTDSDTVPCQ